MVTNTACGYEAMRGVDHAHSPADLVASPQRPGSNLGDEPRERFAIRVRRLLLEEVVTLDRRGLLVRPGPAEFPLLANQKAPGVGVDEEFRDRTGREPLRVVFDDRGHVGRFASDRQISRP